MRLIRPLIAATLLALPLVGGPLAGSPDRSRAASPAQGCEFYADKSASPTAVLLGQEVEVTLTLDGRCPAGTGGGPADIVLALDRSASQHDNGTWAPTVAAARTFIELVDMSSSQIGLLTFSGGGPLEPPTTLHQPLSSDRTAVLAALDAVPPAPQLTFSTNLTAAVRESQRELAGPRGRPEAKPVLVLLSDGQHNALLDGRPEPEAQRAKDAGTTIITIGLAVDAAAEQTLRTMASRPELYFPAPSGADLETVYREVAGAVRGGTLTELEIVDQLPPEVELIDGSVDPVPDSYESHTLTWRLPALPSGGWVARYRVRPLVTGTYSTNKLAYVDFLDADGTPGSRLFPQPEITVSTLPEPGQNAVYLPSVWRGHCKPSRPIDVVLVVDTSSSMWGEKLTRTREAARGFLDLLDMPPWRAAVVAFNADATRVQDLTGDRATVQAALDRLPRGEGTRIDRALAEATAVLTPRDAGRSGAIILLTDGQHSGQRQPVLDAAAGARRVATTYAIGMGDDADPVLLTAVAGRADRYYHAPSAEDLVAIYHDIAGALPCLGQP